MGLMKQESEPGKKAHVMRNCRWHLRCEDGLRRAKPRTLCETELNSVSNRSEGGSQFIPRQTCSPPDAWIVAW